MSDRLVIVKTNNRRIGDNFVHFSDDFIKYVKIEFDKEPKTIEPVDNFINEDGEWILTYKESDLIKNKIDYERSKTNPID